MTPIASMLKAKHRSNIFLIVINEDEVAYETLKNYANPFEGWHSS